MTLHFGQGAEEDLIRIYRDSVDQFGVAQAERYRTQLNRAFALIDANPRLARLRVEFRPSVRIHPVGARVIVYTADDDGAVRIVRVRHGRED